VRGWVKERREKGWEEWRRRKWKLFVTNRGKK
jgi:hypothetical protein